MSAYLPLKLWRDAQPQLTKQCAHCAKEFSTKFAIYCSPLCKVHASRRRAREAQALQCDLCAAPLPKRRARFCCTEHKQKFWRLVRAGREIPVKVSQATTLYTKKYDDIKGVRQRWLERQRG